MQPIIDKFNSLIRPALRNFAVADTAFVAAQAAGTGVDEARQAVMLAARQAAIELHHFADFVLTNPSPPVVFAAIMGPPSANLHNIGSRRASFHDVIDD